MYLEAMGKHTNIFKAEINAVDRCAFSNHQRKYSGQNVAILTDSQVAIKALRSNQRSSKLVWGCLKGLNMPGSHNYYRYKYNNTWTIVVLERSVS